MSENRPNAHADENLVNRCLAGDETAWAALTAVLLRLARAWVARRQAGSVDLEDLVQQTILVLLHKDSQALHRFDARLGSLAAYLAVILARHAMRKPEPPNLALDPALEELLPGDFDQELDDKRLAVWQTAERLLKPTDLLILRWSAQGYQAAEIAEMLTRVQQTPFSAENVRQRRSRALAKLRRKLADRNGRPK